MTLIIQEQCSLKNKNWFQTGGNARFFCEPTCENTFQQALAFAHKQSLPIFVLGEGANILISDEGFDGLVIRPRNTAITHNNHPTNNNHVLVSAGAGATIAQVISYCLDHAITGLEEFSGIPGTVGGSVFINLHYFSHFLSHFLEHALVIEKKTGTLHQVTADWFQFGYDKSKLMQGNYYLLQATFTLKKATELETAYAKGRSVEIIRHRLARYPHSHTCGSFFRNFHEEEVSLTSQGKKVIWVAYYLDKIGIKGHLSVGDAIVSYQHANMIVNRGNATSTDIVTLARTMQELVAKEFGILPQPECLLVGFKHYPLLSL